MRKKQDSITKIMELYGFLISVDKTTYAEIRSKFGIGSDSTVRKYLDLIQYIFNVNVKTSTGVGGGTMIKRIESALIHLSTEQQRAVTAVLQNEALELWIRKEMYKILFDLGNMRTAASYLEKYKSIMSTDNNN